MSEKKPESEPKKKSILDELRNFQIASLAIQHQAGIHGPHKILKLIVLLFSRIFKSIGPVWSVIGSNFYDPMKGSLNPWFQERLEDFIRENLQFGDPLIQCLLEKQSEAYEGSHLELAVHKLASLCIKDNAVKGITPSAIAAIGSKCKFFILT